MRKKIIIVILCVFAVCLIVFGIHAATTRNKINEESVKYVTSEELTSEVEYAGETEEDAKQVESAASLEEMSESEETVVVIAPEVESEMEVIRYTSVSIVLANEALVNKLADDAGITDYDLNSPYSYNGDAVVYDGVQNEEQIQFQVTLKDLNVEGLYVLGGEEEYPDWVPAGDSDRSDNLVITEVGKNKFDMSYREHAELFEKVIADYGFEDVDGCTLQVHMRDDGDNILIEIWNNGLSLTFQDTGAYFKTWYIDETEARFYEKTRPFNEVLPE